MKKVCVGFLFLLLGGCASLDDFRAMTPSQRADYVCESHSDVRLLDSQVANTESAIAETSSAIAAGYRLHRSCKQVPVTRITEKRCTTERATTDSAGDNDATITNNNDSTITNDNDVTITDGNDSTITNDNNAAVTKKKKKKRKKDVRVCKEVAKITHEEVCDDILIVIDGAFERDKLADYRGRLRTLQSDLSRTFDRCYSEVRGMSAEQAFNYYQSGRGNAIF